MFTGIIEEIGTLQRVLPVSHGLCFRITANRVLEDLKPEDSVAVNGVCLTATKIDRTTFEVTAVDETLERSTLRGLGGGQKVNLERALRVGDRMGGHMVQGHIDGTGKVISSKRRGDGLLLIIEIPERLVKYTVEKGSIAIDGVSLTIADVSAHRLTFAIIPYTLEHTTLGALRNSSQVNLEVDVLGKYVERLLENRTQKGRMDEAFLRSMGY
jgi:riboflavin synthase